jgi:AraC-like DNA-binding protein
MLLSISYAGFIISFVLIFFLNKTNRANLYLIFFFLINSIFGLVHHAIMYSKSPILIAILSINFIPLFTLSGPSLYLYFRSTINGGNAKIRPWDFLHFLPSFVLLLNALPYMLTSFQYKIEVAKLAILNTSSLALIPHPFISANLTFVFFPIQGLLYISFCIMLYFFHLKKHNQYLIPPFKFRWDKNWHFIFLLISFLLYFSYSITSVITLMYGIPALKNEMVLMVLNVSVIFFFLSNLSILLFPKELYGIPLLGNHIKKFGDELSEMENDIHFSKKASVFFLTPSRISEIAEAIKAYLLLSPCIRPGFNLGQMSLELHIPKHQLTYFFNDHLKITFNDWKNKIRIAHFISLLKNGQAINNTLESLSQSSGFLSRSKFTNAFKKSQGMTPSAFIKDLILD